MRIRRTSMLKAAACFAILALLLGVGAASAAERDERVSKDLQKIHKPFHFKTLGAGKYQGQPSFFKEAGSSQCTSGCCWATANCEGADTECSESRCDAWCADGSHAGYSCNLE